MKIVWIKIAWWEQRLTLNVKFGEIEGCKIGCGAVQVTENGLDKNAKWDQFYSWMRRIKWK